MIAETKVVVKYSSCGGRRLPVQMGPQRNQETMSDCRDCHNVNVMSQCCPSLRLFNELWNVIVPWWVSWTTMIPDTKKCGGGRLHWLSLRPRTTPPWHCHSDYQFLPTPVTYGVPLPSIPSLGRPALVPTGDHGTIPKSACWHRALELSTLRPVTPGRVAGPPPGESVSWWCRHWK